MKLALLALAAVACSAADIPLRSRAQLFKGSEEWQEVRTEYKLDPQRTAIIICDMWDNHWCSGATQRVNEMVKRCRPVQGSRPPWHSTGEFAPRS